MLLHAYRICRRAVAQGFMLTVTLGTVLDQAFAETPINWGKDNPYQSVVTQWLSLPSEQRDAIKSWASPYKSNKDATVKLSAQQQQIVADLSSAVRLAAQDTRDIKWLMTVSPTDPDNPAALSAAYISPLRQLGQITIQSAATASSDEAINNYLAVTQMGRQLRQNSTFINQLSGISLEAKSTQAMVERLGEFSAADLDRLTAARARLKPVPSIETVFREGERNQFFYPLLDRIIGPGLAAVLAEKARLETGVSAAVEDEVVTSLRLSGIITGSENLIGLERTQDGTSFWVREGQTVQGVTLQSIDRMRKLAYIRIGEANAVVQLASKQVLICRPAGDAKRLRGMFIEGGGDGSEFEVHIIRLISAYPNRLVGYLDHLRLEYEKGLMQAVNDADQVKVPLEKPSLASTDTFLLSDQGHIFSKVGRIINSGNLNEFLMDAALLLRRQELAGLLLEPPLDPWAADGSRLKLERGEDGRLNLSSVYEKKAGAPQTLPLGVPINPEIRKRSELNAGGK